MILAITLSLCLLATFLLHFIRGRNQNRTKLPPGPPGLPLIGNVLQISKGKTWLTFSKWNDEYGPIIHLNLAGQHAVVLGNGEVATELLDRRAAIYSGRPKSIVIDILTGGLIFAFKQYDDTWKRMRKAVHKALNNNATKKYHSFQEAESVLVISQLLEKPEEFKEHLHRASNSLVLSLLYGQPPIASSSDPKIQMVAAFTERLTTAGAPGANLVEFFTWMRFLPRWMCKWKRDAEDCFVTDSEMVMDLMEGVEKRMNEGTQKPCFMSSLLEDNKQEFSKLESAWMAITLYAAGADIVSDEMTWFVMAMVLYPEAQKRAKEEIDRIVGRERLPNMGDYNNLTYIKALLTECSRWRPIAPMGVPHMLDQDDVYNGYFIPKGTICIPNVWAINRDPEVYGSDVEEFRPERYLDASTGKLLAVTGGGKDEGHVSFGFGRRICVGRHVANDSMFILMACILWAFNISPAKDELGNVVIPNAMEFINEGLATRPKPFPCRIAPRFEGVERVVDYAKEMLGI
ncbi:cytochrome P450 [Cyathus striatus]|nr:cytochrome P450 [Cyathus striatus]